MTSTTVKRDIRLLIAHIVSVMALFCIHYVIKKALGWQHHALQIELIHLRNWLILSSIFSGFLLSWIILSFMTIFKPIVRAPLMSVAYLVQCALLLSRPEGETIDWWNPDFVFIPGSIGATALLIGLAYLVAIGLYRVLK
jgi:hypothetical protein